MYHNCIINEGHFFAKHLLILMQDCPNLNYFSYKAWFAWFTEGFSFLFHITCVEAQPSAWSPWSTRSTRFHLPTSLRVHRNKQTLIFAFIAAHQPTVHKNPYIQLSIARECKRNEQRDVRCLLNILFYLWFGPFLNKDVCECFDSTHVTIVLHVVWL